MSKCKTNFANTGKSRCQIDWGLIKKVIVTPLGEEFTGADIDSWLMANIHAADPTKRFYPMPDFTGVEDNSTEGSSYTSGYGQTKQLTNGLVAMTQTFNPDVCLQNRLLSAFNDNMTYGLLFIDNANRVWGVKTDNGLKGFTGNVHVRASRVTTPDTIAEPTINYSLTLEGEMQKKWFEESDLTAEEIEGLLDVKMTVTTESTNLVIKFNLDGCGGDDVTAEMTSIGGVAACWLVDGSAIATAPTYDATTNTFKVAANTVASTKTLTLASPAVLYANNVSNKECVNGYTAA